MRVAEQTPADRLTESPAFISAHEELGDIFVFPALLSAQLSFSAVAARRETRRALNASKVLGKSGTFNLTSFSVHLLAWGNSCCETIVKTKDDRKQFQLGVIMSRYGGAQPTPDVISLRFLLLFQHIVPSLVNRSFAGCSFKLSFYFVK